MCGPRTVTSDTLQEKGVPANSTIITLSEDLYTYLTQNQSKYQDILLKTVETIAQQQGNSRAITLEDWTTYLQNTLGKESEFFTKFDQFEAFSQGFILEALAEHQSKTASEAETKTPETVDVLSFVKEKVMKKLSDFRKRAFSQKFEMLKLLYLNRSFNNKIQSIIHPFSAPNSGASSKMNDQAEDQTQALSALDVVINHGLTELPNDRILVEACRAATYRESFAQWTTPRTSYSRQTRSRAQAGEKPTRT